MRTLSSAISMVKWRCFAISGRRPGSSELCPRLSQSSAGQGDCSAPPRVRAVAASVRSEAVADYPAGAHNRPRYHSATEKQYCPSSSAVARHSTPERYVASGDVPLRRNRSRRCPNNRLSRRRVATCGGAGLRHLRPSGHPKHHRRNFWRPSDDVCYYPARGVRSFCSRVAQRSEPPERSAASALSHTRSTIPCAHSMADGGSGICPSTLTAQ
jgi:hypothetical protein